MGVYLVVHASVVEIREFMESPRVRLVAIPVGRQIVIGKLEICWCSCVSQNQLKRV